MKRILTIILISAMIFVFAAVSFADEPAVTADTGSESEYVFPTIKPQIIFNGGYRFVDFNGTTRADEYEYLHNSFTFSGEAMYFSFPHRFHLDLDFKNKKDYFGDLGYSYEDIVVFRGINRTLWHNLDNITLIDLNPATVNPQGSMVTVRDAGTDYGMKVGMSQLFLRLKTPDFPLHAYVDAKFVDKDGSMQQRFLGGSGEFTTSGTSPNNDSRNRVSQRREVDWSSGDITVGLNSHLGPVEVDYSHGEKRFYNGNEPVQYEKYLDYVSSGKIARAAGEYAHNLVPDLKGSTDTLKIHTSYTGGLVGSVTLTKDERENRDSGAKADYFVGSGELTWIVTPKLTVFVKYRHKDIDTETPDFVTVTDRTNPLNTYTYAVAPAIASTSDLVTTTVRYRPMSGMTLRGEYSYEDIRRENIDPLTEIPEKTQKQILTLAADMRIVKGLTLNAKYIHRDNNNPAYNIDPDRADEGKITVTWIPVPTVSSFLSYILGKEKRGDIRIAANDTAKDRDVTRNRLVASVTVTPLDKLSLTGSYSYFSNKIVQDIAVGGIPVDFGVPYKDTANSYTFDVAFAPKPNISLAGGVNYTLGSGFFSPNDPNLLQPVDISSFSNLKTRETVFYANGEIKFRGGFAAVVQYKYSEFKDTLDNPHDDNTNGRAHIVLLTLSKKW